MDFSNINYNLYKSFIAVYENKNISRAAKELYITQPNLSRNIKELEKFLDIKLFHSHPRGVEPTNEGTELYNKVAPAFAWIDLGEKSVKEFTRRSAGKIRIAIATNFGGYLLSRRINGFHEKYPNIQFELINIKSDEAIEMLERRTVDFVLCMFPNNKNVGFESHVLCALTETYFASSSYAQANGIDEVITPEKLYSLPLILHRMQVFENKPVAIVESQEMMFQLVINGLGIGRCIEQFLESNHPNDGVFKFAVRGHQLPEHNMYCVYSKDFLTKAAKEFLKRIINNGAN